MLRKYYAFKLWLCVAFITLACGMISFAFIFDGPNKAPLPAELEFHSGIICYVSGTATSMRFALCNDENFYSFRPGNAAMGGNLARFHPGAQVDFRSLRESETRNHVFELRLPRDGVFFAYEDYKRHFEARSFWMGIASIFIFLSGATALFMKITGWNVRKIPGVRHVY